MWLGASMTSILTNTAAMSALSNLTATQGQLSRTQAQVSSGLAVATASDNAAYWSIGQTMSAQVAGLKSARDGQSLIGSIADVTRSGLTQVLASLTAIKADLVTAQEAGVNLTQVQSDIAARQQTIVATASSSSFNGENWLSGSSEIHTTVEIHDSYDSDYATWQTEDDHTASASLVVNKTTTYEGESEKVDGHGHTSQQTVSALLNSRYYNQYYGDYSTLSRNVSGALASDSETYVSGVSSQSTLYGSIPVGNFQLFTSSSSTKTVNHTTTWTDGTTVTDSNDLPPWFPNIGLSAASGVGILQQAFSMAGRSVNVSNMNIATASRSEIVTASGVLQTAIDNVNAALGSLGGVQNLLVTQQAFTSSLSDALTSGIGSLVDADMNVASVRLQALQTQQQLGIQALSIANQNSQLVLKLFQAA